MRKPSKQVLVALCNLDSNADFRVIKEWFLESAADQDTVLRSAESAPILYRAQGAIKELLEFCDISTDTKEKAGKLAQKQAGIRSIP